MSWLCFLTSGSFVSAASSGLSSAGLAPEDVVFSVDFWEADFSDEEDEGVEAVPSVVDSGELPDAEDDFAVPLSAGAFGPGCSLSTCELEASDFWWPD